MVDDQFPDYLNVYYKKLFPYSQFFKWLSYGNSEGYIVWIIYVILAHGRVIKYTTN